VQWRPDICFLGKKKKRGTRGGGERLAALRRRLAPADEKIRIKKKAEGIFCSRSWDGEKGEGRVTPRGLLQGGKGKIKVKYTPEGGGFLVHQDEKGRKNLISNFFFCLRGKKEGKRKKEKSFW